MSWSNVILIDSKSFTCGYCSNLVASSIGYRFGSSELKIYICPHCSNPTFFNERIQLPGVSPGNAIENLPVDIESLYNETRKCVAASCYTAAVLLCRKLLMNIGVAQGANTGESFIKYVEYLSDKGFVPPNGKGWVDHIRKKGNEANHEIVLMSKTDADELILFIEMLLKFIYEFPNKIPIIK
ncbi:MAG: DUF4145 domain-containing protein [Acidobacteriota bacterium]|nr:DUF4145 domain-containing protein [Acidobacteriota bacterium]